MANSKHAQPVLVILAHFEQNHAQNRGLGHLSREMRRALDVCDKWHIDTKFPLNAFSL